MKPRLICEIEEGPAGARTKRVVTLEDSFMYFGRSEKHLLGVAAKERKARELPSPADPRTQTTTLSSEVVSSIHCKVWYEKSMKQFFVCDCKSRNGTWLAPPAALESTRAYDFLGDSECDKSDRRPLSIMSAIKAANVIIVVTNIEGTDSSSTRLDLSDAFNYTDGGTMTEDVSKQDIVVSVIAGPSAGQHQVLKFGESCAVGRTPPGSTTTASPSQPSSQKRISIYTKATYLSRVHVRIGNASASASGGGLSPLRPISLTVSSKNGAFICRAPNMSNLESFAALPWVHVENNHVVALAIGDLVRCGIDTVLLVADHAGPPHRLAPPVCQGVTESSITLAWDKAISPTAVKGYILAMAPGPGLADPVPPAQFTALLDASHSKQPSLEQNMYLHLSFTNEYGGGQLSTTVAPLEPDRIYFFRLQARNAGGESSWSAVVAFATSPSSSIPEYVHQALAIHNRSTGAFVSAPTDPGSGDDTDDEDASAILTTPGDGSALTQLGLGSSSGSHPPPMSLYQQKDGATIRWKCGKKIGRGAQGDVFVGQDLDTLTVMAVKVIECEEASLDSSELANIEKEVETLRKLDHPNIVKYIGMNRMADGGRITLHLFLEYVAGGSLRAFIKQIDKAGLDPSAARMYTKQILHGLSYLHSQNIVHRDIKSANILLAIFGNYQVCKIADFGASIALSNLAEEFTSLTGTPNFMAPEVIRQDGGSHKADIWSVGCTVIEMLTGQPPWAELNLESPLYHIAQTKRGPSRPQGIDARCAAFLDACFVIDPAGRASADDLLNSEWLLDPSSGSAPPPSLGSSGFVDPVWDAVSESLATSTTTAALGPKIPVVESGGDSSASITPARRGGGTTTTTTTGSTVRVSGTDSETDGGSGTGTGTGTGKASLGARRKGPKYAGMVLKTSSLEVGGSSEPPPASPSFKDQSHIIPWAQLEFLDDIGKGGYGMVTRAEYLGLDVAVKFLTKVENIEDFISEAALLANLRHPNCVLYMGVCSNDEEKRYGIVMEYLDGGDLHRAIHSPESPPLDVATKVRILSDVASGLVYIHANNIAHRDIKLRNILLDKRSYQAKLADFGLSTPQLDQTAATLRYAAPEVLSGERVADAVADVYSFGLVMLEVLTGIKPFAFLRETKDRYKDLTLVPGEPPSDPVLAPLADAMRLAWSYDPACRPGMKEILRVIKSVLAAVEGTGAGFPLSPLRTTFRSAAPIEPYVDSPAGESGSTSSISLATPVEGGGGGVFNGGGNVPSWMTMFASGSDDDGDVTQTQRIA